MATEDFCGVLQDVSERETRSGTKYQVCKWTCPNCRKACTSLDMDGEHCHGDGLSISYVDGKRTVKCGACWLGGDMLSALRKAAETLACACVDAPGIEPHEAYEAVCAAIASAERRD